MHAGGGGRQPGEGAIGRSAPALVAAVLAALPASGCGSAAEDSSVSRNDVALELSRVEVRPGLWDVTSEIVSAAQEGLPHEIAARMKGRRRTLRHCITPEQAARPDAGFLAARQSGRCRDEAFAMAGGRISGSMVCTEGAGETRVRTSGRYDPERYETWMEIETPGIGEGRVMRLVTQQAGRRIGACPQETEERK